MYMSEIPLSIWSNNIPNYLIMQIPDGVVTFFAVEGCMPSLDIASLIAKGKLLSSPPMLTNLAVEHSDEQRFYPNIAFTCKGSITSVSFAALKNPGGEMHPEVQLWRENGQSLHDYLNAISLAAATRTSTPNLYQLELKEPLTFQRGDALGLYLPRNVSSRFAVQFQSIPEGQISGLALIYTSGRQPDSIDLSHRMLGRDYNIPMMHIESGNFATV